MGQNDFPEDNVFFIFINNYAIKPKYKMTIAPRIIRYQPNAVKSFLRI